MTVNKDILKLQTEYSKQFGHLNQEGVSQLVVAHQIGELKEAFERVYAFKAPPVIGGAPAIEAAIELNQTNLEDRGFEEGVPV